MQCQTQLLSCADTCNEKGEGMERLGLVTQLERELERTISLGRLPRDGELPSEQTLAQQYGVSRTTAREALLRLAARGLVVQHPGRRTRAVALDEAVTLENLGVALHGEDSTHPQRRRLLEGYLSIKRDTTVELLAICCEQASDLELARLTSACFALEDSACWERQRHRWAALEFELLRQAARVADRPGHSLLLQSLERAFRGIHGRVEPYLDSSALHQWARFAREALQQRDARAVRTRLPALLEACDERVLAARAPSGETWGMLEGLYERSTQEPELSKAAEPQRPSAPVPDVKQAAEIHGPAAQALEVKEAAEISSPEAQAPVAREPAALPHAPTQPPEVRRATSELAEIEGPGSLRRSRSGCMTGSSEVSPGGASSAPGPTSTCGAPGSTALGGNALPCLQPALASPALSLHRYGESRLPSSTCSEPGAAPPEVQHSGPHRAPSAPSCEPACGSAALEHGGALLDERSHRLLGVLALHDGQQVEEEPLERGDIPLRARDP
jgi:GntR family transcriptional repressor for pyruvate dehydrogenase complex